MSLQINSLILPLPPPSFRLVGPCSISALSFDFSSQYLACCGGGKTGGSVTILNAKDFGEIACRGGAHSKTVTGVAWAMDATYLATCSLDKSVKVHK